MEISRTGYRYRPVERPENDRLRANTRLRKRSPRSVTGLPGLTCVGRGTSSTTSGSITSGTRKG